jgi:hypothetical protein
LKIEKNFLGLDGGWFLLPQGCSIGIKLISAIVLKKGLLMSYGKTLELGFLGLRGKHQDRFYLRDRRKIIYNGQ